MMKKKCMIFLVVTFVLLVLPSSMAVNDFDQYKPYLHNPSVGNVPKLETFGEYKTELYPGAGTYTYNIAVPNGVLGLQPLINIFYNSQSVLQRPGILGVGWSLSENSISRNINYTLNDTSDDYFILSFNNNRLKIFYNGSFWNSELNPHQYRIQNLSNGEKIYWLVTTTDGTEYRFGFNNDSMLNSNTGRNYTVKWNLDLIKDVNENKIFYSYNQNPFAEDKGTIYLSNITYNNDEKKLILFSYESQSRPDRRLIYDQGNILDESRRLNGISIFFDGSLVRRYSLNYKILSDIQSLSSLGNITYVGSDNSSVLNTITFEYYNTTQGFDNTTNKWLVPGGFVFSSSSSSGQDFGVRLLDVNNDGFPDLIKAKSGEAHETRLNNKQDGWNSSSTLVIPFGVEIADANSVDQGVRFEDVNSDGLIDILQAKEGDTKKVYINNGTSWNDATTNWTIPINFIGSSSEWLGVELTDINGDGKVDIIRSQEPSTKEIYINNRTGWENATSEWNLPDFFSTSDNKDTGLRILDINNDGLPDLIKGGIPGNAWFNNESGWTPHSEYAPNLEFVDNSGSRPDLGVRFIELNGDGLVDMVQNFLSNVSIINQTCIDQGNSTEECIIGQNITFATNAKLNNGTGWMSASGWLSPEKFTNEGLNIGRRVADVNGDGYPDIVVAYQGPPSENITHIKNATNAFLLKKVTGAYGGETEISYTQSTLSDNRNNLGFNIWVVKNTSLNNSVGNGFETESEYSYLYFNGKFDYLNKEFRGFGIVNETLPDSSTVSHFFHQDNALKGREFKTSIYDSQGNHIRDNLNSYSISGDNMIYLNETSSQIYDGEAIPFVTNVTFEYDSYGNVQEINNLGDIAVSGDEKFETFNYFYNTTTFVVNKPSNYTLFASDSSTIVNQIKYFYDNQISGVNIGRLTKVENINNLGENPKTLYAYDSLGNIIILTDSRGYNTTYGYDSTGSFKTNETNALGHIIQYNYNRGTSNLLSEVREGLNKTFEYDTFGRLTKEIISPDTSGSPTTIYTYDFDGTAPESIKIEKKNNNSDYSENIFIYDGFGNVIQTRTLFIPATTQIVSNYFYDNSYRITRIQNPYFESYSSDLTSPASGLVTNYTYDPLSRVTNITKPDGSAIGIIFNQDLVKQFDENGNQIDYRLDGHNRIIKVQEYNGTDIYDTTYSYRADDVLTNITDAENNNFIFEYDSLGRRVSLDDPNMNVWTYRHDLNGNLINQTDGRNITTFLTYDALGRLTFKKAGSSNVTFVYDKQHNGTLSNITLNAQYSKPVYYRYTYDDRLRISLEEVSIHTKQNLPGGREWFNTSREYDSQDQILRLYLPADTINYDYNSIGKIDSITGFLNSINYNAFGSVTNKTYNNNLVTNINYNELNRISEIQIDSIQDLIYGYDNVGNVLSINDTENSKFYSMGYDALNRLINTRIDDFADNSNQTFAYNYNPIGNLLDNIHNEKNILNPTSNERIITIINMTYGTRAHAPTSEVISRPSQINVTVCGVLKFPNTLYILQGDISTNNTCFTIEADNVTLDGRGHTVTGDDSQNIVGIEAIDVKDIVVKNLTVGNFKTGIYFESDILNAQIDIFNVNSLSNVGDGIWIYDGSGKHILYNINSSYNTLNGVYFGGTTSVRNANLSNVVASNNQGDGISLAPYSAFSDFTLANIVTNDNTRDGVDIYPAYETKIKNLVSIGNSPGDGLEISEGSDSEITDSNISSLRIDTGSIGMVFLNVSYSKEDVSADSDLVRKWYYRAYVNDTSGNDISNANVTAFNVTDDFAFNLTTNATGYTPIYEIVDYINNGGTKTYYSLYTIYADKITLFDSHTYNVTYEQNNLKDIFTLTSLVDTISPTINFTPPTPANATTQSSSSIYVNLSTSDAGGDHYSFVDFDNFLVSCWRMDDVNGSGDPIDLSSYSNNGSRRGNVYQTDAGYFGKGFSFDGDGDYIQTNATFPRAGSESFWVYPRNQLNDDSRLVSADYNLIVFYDGVNQRARISTYNGSSYTTISTPSNSVLKNQWTHLYFDWSESGSFIYVNGQYSANSTLRSEKITADKTVYMGVKIATMNQYFNGSIDEVLIFNRSLSVPEIKALYNASINQYSHNFTNLAEELHTFRGFAVDKGGNLNYTEKRSIIVNNLDLYIDIQTLKDNYGINEQVNITDPAEDATDINETETVGNPSLTNETSEDIQAIQSPVSDDMLSEEPDAQEGGLIEQLETAPQDLINKLENDYKVVNHNEIYLSALQTEHCSYKPDSINDGYKICKPIIVIQNKRENALILNTAKDNFELQITRGIKNNDLSISYSTDYEFYNEKFLNKSCVNNCIKNYGLENCREQCYYESTRIRWNNWKQNAQQKQIPPGGLIAIRLEFELPQYSTASYNFSYKPASFLLDPDISACGTLDTEGATYTQTQDINIEDPVNEYCILINGKNIVYNGNGHSIRINADNSYYKGIWVKNTGPTIKNTDITINVSDSWAWQTGIEVKNDSVKIINNTVNNNYYGISLHPVYPAYFNDVIIENNTVNYNLNSYYGGGDGIYLYRVNHARIINNHAIGNGRSNVYIQDSEKNNFTDNDFSSPVKNATYLYSSKNNVFLNCSGYTSNQEYLSNSNLTRKWYFDVQVDYTNGTAVNQANVTIWNAIGTKIFSELTDVYGKITKQELTEYINNGTKTYYFYSVNVTKPDYVVFSNNTINLTTNLFINPRLSKESKIKNNGAKDVYIYLLMKVQYYDTGEWEDKDIVYYNLTPMTIQPNEIIKLDQYWNPNAWNTGTNPSGTYRVWAAAVDENNITLINKDDSKAEAYYNFNLS